MANEEHRASGPPVPGHEYRAAQWVNRLMTAQKNRAADGLHRLAEVLRG